MEFAAGLASRPKVFLGLNNQEFAAECAVIVDSGTRSFISLVSDLREEYSMSTDRDCFLGLATYR